MALAHWHAAFFCCVMLKCTLLRKSTTRRSNFMTTKRSRTSWSQKSHADPSGSRSLKACKTSPCLRCFQSPCPGIRPPLVVPCWLECCTWSRHFSRLLRNRESQSHRRPKPRAQCRRRRQSTPCLNAKRVATFNLSIIPMKAVNQIW